MIYFASFIIIVVLLLYFKIIDIRIGFSKPEDKSKINVVDNSYISTLKVFISEDDYEHIIGKVIFFTTWNSMCKGSIEGIPILDKLQKEYSDNNKIVFISYCSDLQPSSINKFLKRRKLEMNFRFISSREGLRSSLRTILSRNPNLPPINPTVIHGHQFVWKANHTILEPLHRS